MSSLEDKKLRVRTYMRVRFEDEEAWRRRPT